MEDRSKSSFSHATLNAQAQDVNSMGSTTTTATATAFATATSAATPALSSKRTHLCPVCSRGFTTTGHLVRHARIHAGERNHKCPFPGCETRCSRQDNLQQHYRIHLSPGSRRNPANNSSSKASSTSAMTTRVLRRRGRGSKPAAAIALSANSSLSSLGPPSPPPSAATSASSTSASSTLSTPHDTTPITYYDHEYSNDGSASSKAPGEIAYGAQFKHEYAHEYAARNSRSPSPPLSPPPLEDSQVFFSRNPHLLEGHPCMMGARVGLAGSAALVLDLGLRFGEDEEDDPAPHVREEEEMAVDVDGEGYDVAGEGEDVDLDAEGDMDLEETVVPPASAPAPSRLPLPSPLSLTRPAPIPAPVSPPHPTAQRQRRQMHSDLPAIDTSMQRVYAYPRPYQILSPADYFGADAASESPTTQPASTPATEIVIAPVSVSPNRAHQIQIQPAYSSSSIVVPVSHSGHASPAVLQPQSQYSSPTVVQSRYHSPAASGHPSPSSTLPHHLAQPQTHQVPLHHPVPKRSVGMVVEAVEPAPVPVAAPTAISAPRRSLHFVPSIPQRAAGRVQVRPQPAVAQADLPVPSIRQHQLHRQRKVHGGVVETSFVVPSLGEPVPVRVREAGQQERLAAQVEARKSSPPASAAARSYYGATSASAAPDPAASASSHPSPITRYTPYTQPQYIAEQGQALMQYEDGYDTRYVAEVGYHHQDTSAYTSPPSKSTNSTTYYVSPATTTSSAYALPPAATTTYSPVVASTAYYSPEAAASSSVYASPAVSASVYASGVSVPPSSAPTSAFTSPTAAYYSPMIASAPSSTYASPTQAYAYHGVSAQAQQHSPAAAVDRSVYYEQQAEPAYTAYHTHGQYVYGAEAIAYAYADAPAYTYEGGYPYEYEATTSTQPSAAYVAAAERKSLPPSLRRVGQASERKRVYYEEQGQAAPAKMQETYDEQAYLRTQHIPRAAKVQSAGYAVPYADGYAGYTSAQGQTQVQVQHGWARVAKVQ